MKRSLRLSRIVRLSNVAEQRAAVAMARTESELSALDAQRRELRHYQTDYLKRLGVASSTLAGYEAQKLQVFVQRIEQAIMGLERKIAALRKRLARERQLWLDQQRRHQVVGEIAGRVRGDEMRAVETSLQCEIDDRPRPRMP